MATQCNDIEALLPTYLDGELAPHDQLSFDHHMADCGECRERLRAEGVYLSRMRELLVPPTAPGELVLRVREALDREDRQTRAARRRSWRTWALPSVSGLAAAAALTVLVIAELSGGRGAPSEDDDDGRVAHHAAPASTLVSLTPALARPVQRDRSVAWNPRQMRFEVQLVDGRSYQLLLEVLTCRSLDFSGYRTMTAAGAELWVTRGSVNTVIYRSSPAACLVFSSDMDLDVLVQQVVRSGLVGP